MSAGSPSQPVLRCLFALGALLLAGCETVEYYGQAVHGHLSILAQRQSIDKLIDDASTDPKLKQKLQLAEEILQFSEQNLLLPAAGQYRSYVELDRRYVVWNVVAAPIDAMRAKQWCYPVIGCASYRGYYHQHMAKAKADELQQQGYDIHLGGVGAYSTLGWFKDPLLSSFIQRDDIALAELIFHELAHQHLYIKGQSTFNESYATAVAQVGLERWLSSRGQQRAFEQYQQQEQRDSQVIELILRHRQIVADYYQQATTEGRGRQQILQEREKLFEQLRSDYEQLVQPWTGYQRYRHWLDNLNNAKLGTLSTYHSEVPRFLQLWQQSHGDIKRFYQLCEAAGAAL